MNIEQPFEQPLMIGTLLILLVIASYTDLQARRIPNTVTFTGATLGVLLHSVSDGLPGMLFALAGLAVGVACLLPGYVLGQTGAGDAKLLGAVGTFLGPGSTLLAGVASVLAGSIMAFLVACFAAGQNPWGRYALMLRHFFATRKILYLGPQEGERMSKKFPFAPAIAAGSVVGASHFLGLVDWWVLSS